MAKKGRYLSGNAGMRDFEPGSSHMAGHKWDDEVVCVVHCSVHTGYLRSFCSVGRSSVWAASPLELLGPCLGSRRLSGKAIPLPARRT